MTPEEFAQLDKPSELLQVAIQDIKSLDREVYMPDAFNFHNPTRLTTGENGLGNRCLVCDAGAVIAGTLNGTPSANLFPGKYEPAIEARLCAIDSLRRGSVLGAMHAMNLVDGRNPERSFAKIEADTAHIEPPAMFGFWGWDDMDRHVQSLERFAGELSEAGY